VRVVVAGALIASGRVLVAQRTRPPELAGRWELPGGKVGPGETEQAALARELAEELGVDVAVGPRLGDDVALSETITLRAYLVTQACDRDPHPHDHRALHWAAPSELDQLEWVPADRAWLPELARMLTNTAIRRETP
jgi:8-oxo-dGTP diphosphatase